LVECIFAKAIDPTDAALGGCCKSRQAEAGLVDLPGAGGLVGCWGPVGRAGPAPLCWQLSTKRLRHEPSRAADAA
jgi:hypothetical protein